MAVNQGWKPGEIRTVFLSDVHLGHKHSQGTALLDFLKSLRTERLFLVGDIIDGWEFRRGITWSPVCTDILRRLTEMAQTGTRLFYIPGNHDAFLRDRENLRFVTDRFPFVEIADEFLIETADGRRFLVTHGDLFDFFERSLTWFSVGLGVVYNHALSANRWLSRLLRRKRGSQYSICSVTKRIAKKIVRFISRFEHSLMEHARRNGCDGVICGHLHTPKVVERDGMVYCNTGDWVEHCTALIEFADGSLSLVHFYGNQPEVRSAAVGRKRIVDEFSVPEGETDLPADILPEEHEDEDEELWRSSDSLAPVST